MNVKRMLIIGDSLSYNRNDYDPVLRWNSYDCYPDMGSWSFCLRDALIQSAHGFVFGAELAASQVNFSHTVFGDKAFCGLASVQLSYAGATGALTLYLQKQPDGGKYRIEIDGGFSAVEIDFKGEQSAYQGRAVFAVTLPADPALDTHAIAFVGEGAFVLLGVACECKEANISGRGSQTVRFFVENFDEWVKKFEFDTLISVLGANDIKHTPLDEFEADYTQLIKRVREVSKGAEIVMILPPDMSDPDDLDSDRKCYCSKKTAAPYMDILHRLADRYRLHIVDTWALFENVPITKWRFDDVHFNKFGNRVLFEKTWEILCGGMTE
jgi:hypothetical protein